MPPGQTVHEPVDGLQIVPAGQLMHEIPVDTGYSGGQVKHVLVFKSNEDPLGHELHVFVDELKQVKDGHAWQVLFINAGVDGAHQHCLDVKLYTVFAGHCWHVFVFVS